MGFLSLIESLKSNEGYIAYRFQQYDIHGTYVGSRSSTVSCEVQSPNSRLLGRKCILIKLTELTIQVIRDAAFHNSGGVIVILPSNRWDESTVQHFAYLERELLLEEIPLALYFTFETPSIENSYSSIHQATVADQNLPRSYVLWNAIWSTGYRFSIDAPVAKALPDHEIFNLQAKIGGSFNSEMPVIVLVAHYDTFASIPGLATGADSNASGVTVLLEVMRMLKRVFQLTQGKPNYSFLFLLTGGGKFNFIGSKRWLEKNMKLIKGQIKQVICLEGMGKLGSLTVDNDGITRINATMYAHMSKLPKEDTPTGKILKAIEVANKLHPIESTYQPKSNTSVNIVHKKINLNQEELAWEHERFSLHRLPGLTLSSSWSNVDDANLVRRSSLDIWRSKINSDSIKPIDPSIVARNARVVAEALVRLSFDMDSSAPGTQESPIISTKWSNTETASSLLQLLTRQPRATQYFKLPHNDHLKSTLLSPDTKQSSDVYKTDTHSLWTNSAVNEGNSNANAQQWKSKLTLANQKALNEGGGLLIALHNYMTTISDQVTLLRYPLNPQNDANGERDVAGHDATSRTFHSSSANPAIVAAAAHAEHEITFYSGVVPVNLRIYGLKSSVFDIATAIVIATYLTIIYLLFENYDVIEQTIGRFVSVRPGLSKYKSN